MRPVLDYNRFQNKEKEGETKKKAGRVVVKYALAYYNGKMSVEISKKTHRIIYIVNM